MAATFNPSMFMTSDFFQENYSEDLGPSSKEIEEILSIEMESDLENFIDSITPKEAYSILCDLLKDCR